MHQWVKLGGMSLIIWWALIGGLLMTYLYSVAGYAYLHDEFLRPEGTERRRGAAPDGHGGRRASSGRWPAGLMLLFIMVTLYDAQFPFYDTYIGRTTTDAIAVTGKTGRQDPTASGTSSSSRLAVLAGFYLIMQERRSSSGWWPRCSA